ncbi:hypothetical protein [Mucilaginibacter myungsuensis]|uniref:Uncharacterized protein n=1 Tax=Mucilaginibacter myungsuensis TaxID=649104 RepID=A0A929L2Q2_9SPHI|nr:hypothetical protein [Mucilaginibacter myungsuensis]MBE9664553.1 hypothetical protein [Mucilaginibacter myungsuensis]MDN3601097.1 hypothetical protein [Mucilaginibacter myungsuensis]
MNDYLTAFGNWLESLGEDHGVNPWILGPLYFTSKVIFVTCLAWTVKNLRKKKPVTKSLMCAGAGFSIPYLYIIIFGHDISIWVYVFIVCFILFGVFNAWRQLSKASRQPDVQ